MAPDFFAFANAGRDLATLHLGYETCEEYPLVIESIATWRAATRALSDR